MDVTWLDPQNLRDRDVNEAVALLHAVKEHDAPFAVSPILPSYAAHLRHGWDGEPSRMALARDADGLGVGLLEVHTPRRDNRHLAFVEVTVDPTRRRQEIGTRLFECALEQAKRAGRSLLLTECLKGGPGVAFLEKMGLQRASVDVLRQQRIRELDWSRLDSTYDEARAAALDYDMVRIPVPTPDDLLDDVVQVSLAINDAPKDDLEVEDDVITPHRVRDFEHAQEAQRRRTYRVAARHLPSGRLAGHTMVGVEVDRPWHAWQLDTSVLRAHRGHRLGLLLKASMLRWLREEEPQLRTINTWNAASNAHMIGVNELLGYRILAEGMRWQRHI